MSEVPWDLIKKRLDEKKDALKFIQYNKTWGEFCNDGLNFPGIYIVVSRKKNGIYFLLLGTANEYGIMGKEGDDSLQEDNIVLKYAVACNISDDCVRG